MLYYEDIVPGVVKEVGRHDVSREEIVRFAREWDPQPFHIDDEAAAASVFGTLTASSCHTYSISSLIFSRTPEKLATAAMMGLEMKFPKPVRPGDTLVLSEICLEKRLSKSRPGLGIIQGRSALVNQDDEEVMVLHSNYLVHCREGGS